jgi:spore coat polysaccharide biosynthesis protein SpsF (cytidylyltransferase family)
MEPDKYYTPDISEFYVGFEYEQIENCSINGGPKQLQWVKKVFDFTNTSKFNWQIHNYPEEFRVKYLDIQDIEELGYTVKWDEKFKVFNANVKYNELNKMLCFDPTGKRNDTGTNIQTFSNGWFKIKNKSELKKLLTMLDIL